MESIVVGYDGSPPSRAAVDWAARRAARDDCRVEIVRVRTATPALDPGEDPDVVEAEMRVRDIAPHAEVTGLSVSGRMPGALIDAAAQADVLVIGIQRNHPIKAALKGWRSLRLAAQSGVPTVVVPEAWTPVDGGVLVGVDDDDSSNSAIARGAAEAVAEGLPLTLLHAWLMPVPSLEGPDALVAPHAENRRLHGAILEAARVVVVGAHPDLEVRTALVEDNPASALLTRAAHHSLLVIGTHRRGILEGAFIGSVGQDVLVEAAAPVFVVPLVSEVDQPGR